MNNKLYVLPLKWFLLFNVFTQLLFWLGPIRYNINNNASLLLFFVIVDVAFYLGYKRGMSRFKPSRYVLSKSAVRIIILLGLLSSIIGLTQLWIEHGLTFSFSTLVNSLLDPGRAYNSESESEMQTSYGALLLTPFYWMSIPMGIYYWKRLPRLFKIIVVLIPIVSLIGWFGVGVRKGIIDLFIILFFSFVAYKPQIVLEKKNKRKLLLAFFVFVVLFILYFLFSNLSRSSMSSYGELTDLVTGNYKEFYSSNLPMTVVAGLVMIQSYLCQGYYALGLSLNWNIIHTAPMGMSWMTIAIARKFGYDPLPNSYMHYLEKFDIDPSMNWHSIYVWLANDFTFIGVPIIIFLIGYFLAITWCDSLHKQNTLAFPIMNLFVVMCFYSFANNQVLSFSFIPFVFCGVVYYLSSHSKLG